MDAILRRPQVKALTGKPTSTLYRDMARGLFPPPVRLSEKSVGWPESEVEAINRARIAGQSEDEIRLLVLDLVEQRKHVNRRAA